MLDELDFLNNIFDSANAWKFCHLSAGLIALRKNVNVLNGVHLRFQVSFVQMDKITGNKFQNTAHIADR